MRIGERIRLQRESLGMSQEQLAQKLGYKSRSSINKIELGANNLAQTKIKDIAKALKTTPAYIMGWETENYEDGTVEYFDDTLEEGIDFLESNGYKVREVAGSEFNELLDNEGNFLKRIENSDIVRTCEKTQCNDIKTFIKVLLQNAGDTLQHIEKYDNLLPLPKTKKIPLLGDIACGCPILAEENIEALIAAPEHLHADFILKCKGDSMVNARIYDGDLVYIRQQADVDNGQIAAVLIGDSATLKRVYKYTNKVVLQAENNAYEPLIYIDNELEEIKILGLAVAFLSAIK